MNPMADPTEPLTPEQAAFRCGQEAMRERCERVARDYVELPTEAGIRASKIAAAIAALSPSEASIPKQRAADFRKGWEVAKNACEDVAWKCYHDDLHTPDAIAALKPPEALTPEQRATDFLHGWAAALREFKTITLIAGTGSDEYTTGYMEACADMHAAIAAMKPPGEKS